MFNWVKRKKTSDDLQKAKRSGEAFGEQFAQATLAFKTARFGPVYQRYLNVLRGFLQDAIKSEEVPPAARAKWSFENFEENIVKLENEMFAEMQGALGEWLDAIETVGVRDQADQAMREMIARFCNDLLDEGRRVVQSYAAVLADADHVWRNRHPDEISKFYRS